MRGGEIMAFLTRVLEPPRYGYSRDGKLYVPSKKELFREFGHRLNIFADKKNWLALFCWMSSLVMAIPMALFLIYHFSVAIFALGLVYSMVVLGTHGTIWYHRYATHRAYQFTHPIFRFITKHLVVKVIPEEVYVVSHYVHHAYSEEPGDPYNVYGGWLYCFLADAVHQPIARNLSPADYARVCGLLSHTGIRMNSYAQYKKWGSVCHPFFTTINFALNWAFWYGVFYLLGGHALALGMFGFAGVWGIGVRTFNFDGHGAGKDKRQDGIDFNRRDHSINQLWPGLVTGEWHNNHHLYPNSARAGFLPYQLDYAWYYIKFLSKIGGVSGYLDNRPDFYKKHYEPYLERLKGAPAPGMISAID
jgi:fatty-acid desaturase